MRRFVWLVILLLPATAEDGKPVEKPRSAKESLAAGLSWLDNMRWPRADWKDRDGQLGPQLFARYTRARCAKNRTEAHRVAMLDPVHARWEGEMKAGGGVLGANAYPLATIILLVTAANVEKRPKRPSRNVLRPPRGSKFDKKDWKLMHECIVHLTAGSRSKTRNSSRIKGLQFRDGSWGYGRQFGTTGNLATTHFALVALREASLAGYPVSPSVFSKALHYVNSVCDKDFRYSAPKSSHTSTSLQALGMVSAWICQEQLTLAKHKKFPVPPFAKVLVNRLEEFNEVFTLDRNDSGDPNRQYHYYYLWSVEQLGVLSGKKKFADVDWYESGKRYLLSKQAKDGSWDDPTLGKQGTALGTCFALLFMANRTDPLRATRK